MSFLFAVYAHDRFVETFLPQVNNANHTVTLTAEDLGLCADLNLNLEVLDHVWYIRPSKDYSVQRGGRAFEGEPLSEGCVLTVTTAEKEKVAVLVEAAPAELTAYMKYRILDFAGSILIGKSVKADICCTSSKIISRQHARITFEQGRAYVEDLSVNGTYLGSHRLHGKEELQYGDGINMYGLSVYYLGDFLAIKGENEALTINQNRLEELLMVPETEAKAVSRVGQSETTVIHIAPRSLPDFYEGEEKIENIPQKQEQDQRPAWMSVLPSLTMVIPMCMGVLLMGTSMLGIIISGGSAVVGATWAVLNLRYAKKTAKEKEMLRLQRYEEYLVRRADDIRMQFEFNQNALREMYVDAETCGGYAEKSPELWARRANHSDFLAIRIGKGDLPFQVKITAPERGFSLQQDELSERPAKIARSFRMMKDVPLCVDLRHHNVIGVVATHPEHEGMQIIRDMLTQITANHCYTDVKVAVMFDGSRRTAEEWGFVRWLPHNWNEERSMRYFASDSTETDDLVYALMQVLRTRSEQSKTASGRHDMVLPHYVLFVENLAMLESQMICKYLYEQGNQLGITTVILSDSYESLPSACDMVVENTAEFQGMYEIKEGNSERSDVQFDVVAPKVVCEMARRMASMRVAETSYSSDIPNTLTFFEMMKIQRMAELNVLDRWRKNRTYETLRALIGQKAGGADCYLDIHEKFHGPHGLVAGTTGSGKSETLQTYILSLAINYSPQDVGFFIIDFKGGGMANLFSNLPHMLGQISNLSGNQVRRAMVSIQSENHRRQRLFNEHGVNNINDYTKLVKNHEAVIPLPHLLIIIDEFAELKREEPEFMRQLISVAQVGRSLGVHLILATQKPSGTVDDNIWSNTKFKLCLRVADKQDSNDMLHKPDAAYITQTGRGYLQVGNDEVYEQFQSGWSGAVYDATGVEQGQSAVLVHHMGNEQRFGKAAREERRGKARRLWIAEMIEAVYRGASANQISLEEAQRNQEEATRLAKRAFSWLNRRSGQLPENPGNMERMLDLIRLIPQQEDNYMEAAILVARAAEEEHVSLPEQREVTQLEAIVDYLADLAETNHYTVEQQLWMPVLPTRLYLDELDGYREGIYDGGWPEKRNRFSLRAVIGLVDFPEEQKQFPLQIDLAGNGHLALTGSVTSGKSTFLQSMIYSLICHYSPKEVNFYLIDFSSQMLEPFKRAPHVGGIVLEGEDDRLDKLFGLLSSILAERKRLVRGGNFAQYVQVNGYQMPAVVLAIDGYANFREKTDNKFEGNLMELARDAEGYGIYMVIASTGFGAAELQSKIAEKMRQGICLEMSDQYAYGEILRHGRFDVRPESNVKGRGLAVVGDRVLEYQTALACAANNDYERAEKISALCEDMRVKWIEAPAKRIPEIPEKPTWKQFSESEEYAKCIETDFLPAAYRQKDASYYGVSLVETFCYLILGGAASGKSTYLRNLACAARDAGGRLLFVDKANRGDQKTAETVDAEYFSSDEELYALTKQLILLTNERGGKRKQLMEQNMENEDIYAGMKSFRPVFCFIADLADFLRRVYSNLEGIGRLSPNLEIIFAKGKLLNVFFFAALNRQDVSAIMDKGIYSSFIREPQGAVLGGELSKQTIFSCQNIKYNEQGKRLRPGVAYAVDQADNQNMELIVIPQNRGAGGL